MGYNILNYKRVKIKWKKGLIVKSKKKRINEAIAEIIQLTERKAYFIAYKVVNNEATAKDIVQEAYIQAFQKLDQLSDDSKFESWFNQIVSHKALDYTKSKQGKNKPVEFSSLDDEEDRLEFEANIKNDKASFEPEASMNYKELQEGVQGVLSELPENQRLALMMYYFENMSIFEIADIFGVSENAVKDNLAYARKKIMNTLSDTNVRSMSFLSCFLNDQMSKMISCHVPVDTIVEAIRCKPQQVGIYDKMSGILGWWLRKTAISKALIVVLSTTLMFFILGALSGSNYNTIVKATEKLDTLESFHIKGVISYPDNYFEYDVYIKIRIIRTNTTRLLHLRFLRKLVIIMFSIIKMINA